MKHIQQTRTHLGVRRRPRVLRAIVCLLALGAAFSPSAGASSTPAFRLVPITFHVTVGPASARESCLVVADVRIPRGVDRAHPARAAVLMTNGFSGSKSDAAANGGTASFGARFAEQGYVALSYSSLGFGGSGCNITIADPEYDGESGSQLISFLGGEKGLATTAAGTPFDVAGLVRLDPVAHDGRHHVFDPRVGMIGGSSGGEQQFAVAGQDPRLDTIIPIYTWNDLDHALTPNNARQGGALSGPLPGIFKIAWESIFVGTGAAYPVLNPVDPTRTTTCGSWQPWVCQAYAEQTVQGYPSEQTRAHFRKWSVSSYMSHIRIPVLLAQGQADSLFTLNEAAANYAALRSQGTPVRMLWQSWGHSNSTPVPGELTAGTAAAGSGDLRDSVEGKVFSDWFAHWLLDKPTDLGPALRFFQQELYQTATSSSRSQALHAATAAYASSPSYPVAGHSTLYLSGSSKLVTTSQQATTGTATFIASGSTPPAGSGETVVGGAVPQLDAPGTSASWTGSALSRSLEVVGIPRLSVQLDAPHIAATQGLSPLAHLQLFAKIYDVAPDGTRTLVRNLVSAVRVPDVRKPVTIDLPGVVYLFRRGHAIQLVLASADVAYKGQGLAGPVTVRSAPGTTNTLQLPALPVLTDRFGAAAAVSPESRPAAVKSAPSLAATGLQSGQAMLAASLLTLAGVMFLLRRSIL
jgi:predicted acyl esterase